jgi:two-component system, LytTR family, response regulator
MSIRSVIIDDEQNNIENLRAIISIHTPEVEVVATAKTVVDGISAIKLAHPDIVFLDIQMPASSGFDVLRVFDVVDFEVIFITAHDQYGIQAIKFSALDYLLKPINIEEFKQAISKATERIAARQKNHSIENLLQFINTGKKEVPKIALPTLQEIRYVKVDEIVNCEAQDRYTMFYLSNGEQILVCKTLKEYAGLLKPYNFIRTHQSHLVNMHYVKSYLKTDGGTLLLTDQKKIPISRQNLENVKETLNKSL